MPAKKNEVATTRPKRSLIEKMSAERSVDAGDFYKTVTETMFKGATQSQLMTLLLVADRYNLDVTTKEIFAFPDKGGGIVPVVSIDGWISLANQHPQFDGEEIVWSEEWVKIGDGKTCPKWCEIRVYRKDRTRPTVVREYLDEVYRSTPTWKSHTKRMLRHKTMIQGYRVAFGFSGIKDEDEAQRITVETPSPESAAAVSSSAEKAKAALRPAPTTHEAPEAPESAPVAVDEVTGEVLEDGIEKVIVDDTMPPDDYEDAEVEDEPADDAPRATKQQVAAIESARKNNGWSEEAYALLLNSYRVNDAQELRRDDALDVVRHLMAGPDGDEEQEEMQV